MFRPSEVKIGIFFLIIFLLISPLFIPPQLDILDLKQVSGFFIKILFQAPLKLFDFVTMSAFTRKGCTWICFPSIPELIFVFVADVAIIYVVSCVLSKIIFKPKSVNSTNFKI